jgi:hypothetical protein
VYAAANSDFKNVRGAKHCAARLAEAHCR